MISHRQLIFVDTSAFIGLISNRDHLHEQSISVMTELVDHKARLVTSESVLFELANEFSRTQFRLATVEFIEQIVSNADIEVTWSAPELFDSAVGLYKDRPDKAWSLTDCMSFVIMKISGIELAFTSDKHFEQAGFSKLLVG